METWENFFVCRFVVLVDVAQNYFQNDDDDNDVDMDDEAMLRLDPMIAEAFRSQLKKSSNIKLINEKLHHQFRVLDLIESVIKKDERMRFVLLSIRPLIETLISLPNTPAYKSMNERLDSILQHLSSRKVEKLLFLSKRNKNFVLDRSFRFTDDGRMFRIVSLFNIISRCVDLFDEKTRKKNDHFHFRNSNEIKCRNFGESFNVCRKFFHWNDFHRSNFVFFKDQIVVTRWKSRRSSCRCRRIDFD